MRYKHYMVYDDEDFFRKYSQKRNKVNSPNEIIEQPIINELVGEVVRFQGNRNQGVKTNKN